MEPLFCAREDSTRVLAVLGVVTTAGSGWRDAIRKSWLTPLPGLVSRFVLRGADASRALLDEARAHGDMLLLNASSKESKAFGPLHSTLLFLECASRAWPHSHLIVKAEDDMWVHLPSLLSSLHAAHREMKREAIGLMYWGIMEMYSMNTTTWRPMGFGYRGYSAVCSPPSPTSAGPFIYAKGALYAVSRPLALELLEEEARSRRGEAALATADKRLGPWQMSAVYEDVYLGYAISHLALGHKKLALVNFASSMYVERWGLYSSPASVLWHAKLKDPSRLPYISEWKAKSHCSRAEENITISCRETSKTCAGVKFWKCTDNDLQGCPYGIVDLKTALGWRTPSGHAGSATSSIENEIGRAHV